MRLDKWLWAARFFKTRSIAAHACELGRIHSNEQQAKPSREARVGDILRIRTERGDFEVEVLGLSNIRGPAAVAQGLYRETAASQDRRLRMEEERKAGLHFDYLWEEGKPSKRDRRKIDRLRGRA